MRNFYWYSANYSFLWEYLYFPYAGSMWKESCLFTDIYSHCPLATSRRTWYVYLILKAQSNSSYPDSFCCINKSVYVQSICAIELQEPRVEVECLFLPLYFKIGLASFHNSCASTPHWIMGVIPQSKTTLKTLLFWKFKRWLIVFLIFWNDYPHWQRSYSSEL